MVQWRHKVWNFVLKISSVCVYFKFYSARLHKNNQSLLMYTGRFNLIFLLSRYRFLFTHTCITQIQNIIFNGFKRFYQIKQFIPVFICKV